MTQSDWATQKIVFFATSNGLLIIFDDSKRLSSTCRCRGSGVISTGGVHHANVRVEAVEVQVPGRVLEDDGVLSLYGLGRAPAGRHDDQELVAAVGDDRVVVVSAAVVALALPQDAARVVALHPVSFPVGGLEDHGVSVLYVHVLPRHGELYLESLAGQPAAVVGVAAAARPARHARSDALEGLRRHVRLSHLQRDDGICLCGKKWEKDLKDCF